MAKVPIYKRNAEETRNRILAAAQDVFSQKSYGDAGIREIAKIADTSSTLLMHYFGTKLGLFETALTAAIPLPDMFARPRSEFGVYLADALLQPGRRIVAEAMVALAAGDADAAGVAARVVEERGVAPLAEWLGGETGWRRALQIGMLTNGLITYVTQLPMRALTQRERADLRVWFAETAQSVVDETNSR